MTMPYSSIITSSTSSPRQLDARVFPPYVSDWSSLALDIDSASLESGRAFVSKMQRVQEEQRLLSRTDAHVRDYEEFRLQQFEEGFRAWLAEPEQDVDPDSQVPEAGACWEYVMRRRYRKSLEPKTTYPMNLVLWATSRMTTVQGLEKALRDVVRGQTRIADLGEWDSRVRHHIHDLGKAYGLETTSVGSGFKKTVTAERKATGEAGAVPAVSLVDTVEQQQDADSEEDGRWLNVGPEKQSYIFHDDAEVRYGTFGKWILSTVQAGSVVAVTNAFFGGDPAAFCEKALQVWVPAAADSPPTWTLARAALVESTTQPLRNSSSARSLCDTASVSSAGSVRSAEAGHCMPRRHFGGFTQVMDAW
jgi:hypothetical protein